MIFIFLQRFGQLFSHGVLFGHLLPSIQPVHLKDALSRTVHGYPRVVFPRDAEEIQKRNAEPCALAIAAASSQIHSVY